MPTVSAWNDYSHFLKLKHPKLGQMLWKCSTCKPTRSPPSQLLHDLCQAPLDGLMEKYDIFRKVGEGSFGEVLQCRDRAGAQGCHTGGGEAHICIFIHTPFF